MKDNRKVVVDDKGIVMIAYTDDGPVYVPAYVEGTTSMQVYDWD